MTMLERLEQIARERHDGHFTVMRFTTNWRVMFGTIDWDSDLLEWRDAIQRMPSGRTFDEAALNAILAEADGKGGAS